MKAALDTNVLVYAEGLNDVAKRDLALDLLRRMPQASTVIPVQVLGELFNVLLRKAGRKPGDVRAAILGWRDAFQVAPTTADTMVTAMDLATDHRLGIWDAVVLTAASQAGCRVLLSEDMQEGFTWGGVTVVNPFADEKHDLLVTLLGDGS